MEITWRGILHCLNKRCADGIVLRTARFLVLQGIFETLL
jgi:hypothetical protein